MTNKKEPEKTKLSDKTLVSLNVLVVVVGICMWIQKLSDKVDAFAPVTRQVASLKERVSTLETVCKVKPNVDDDGE